DDDRRDLAARPIRLLDAIVLTGLATLTEVGVVLDRDRQIGRTRAHWNSGNQHCQHQNAQEFHIASSTLLYVQTAAAGFLFTSRFRDPAGAAGALLPGRGFFECSPVPGRVGEGDRPDRGERDAGVAIGTDERLAGFGLTDAADRARQPFGDSAVA